MNPFSPIEIGDKPTDLCQRICKVVIPCQVDLLFFDRADHVLGIAVLPRFAYSGHADLDSSGQQGLDILGLNSPFVKLSIRPSPIFHGKMSVNRLA